MRLLNSGADVVAGAYPIKRVDWAKMADAVRAGKQDLASATLNYVLELDDAENVVAVRGFARARYVGTGFLMIRRHVLEEMCGHYLALQFRREHSLADTLGDSPNRFALFDCMIEPKTGTYLSEDFSFCKRWTDMGGDICTDLESRLNHVGPSTFYGDLSTQFTSEGVPSLAPDLPISPDGMVRGVPCV